MPAPTTNPARPGWAQALVPTDLIVVGLDGASPTLVLDDFERVDGVDLNGVTCCLDLLKANPVVLHCGAPRALMAYSSATGCYSASFDGELDEDLAHLTEAQAGLWLANLSTEHGALPDQVDHWYVIHVNGRELSGQDTAAINTYREYADHLDETVPPSAITGEPSCTKVYERLISRAFWALAARCEEGR